MLNCGKCKQQICSSSALFFSLVVAFFLFLFNKNHRTNTKIHVPCIVWIYDSSILKALSLEPLKRGTAIAKMVPKCLVSGIKINLVMLQ